MTDLDTSPMMGRWRIIEADLRDRDFLDLVEPACILLAERGSDLACGAATGGMDWRHGMRNASFAWAGNDEMDEASGSGEAFLQDDDTLTTLLQSHNDDEAEPKAAKL